MTGIILHHYGLSPFAEKVRIGLGLKQAAWKSVDIPNVMPKPDLMPLTGGYRKTPVMQVGADIYCDTQLIMLEGRGTGDHHVDRPQHFCAGGRRRHEPGRRQVR